MAGLYDEALERKPFVVQLHWSISTIEVGPVTSLVTYNFTRPHSKAEEYSPATTKKQRSMETGLPLFRRL